MLQSEVSPEGAGDFCDLLALAAGGVGTDNQFLTAHRAFAGREGGGEMNVLHPHPHFSTFGDRSSGNGLSQRNDFSAINGSGGSIGSPEKDSTTKRDTELSAGDSLQGTPAPLQQTEMGSTLNCTAPRAAASGETAEQVVPSSHQSRWRCLEGEPRNASPPAASLAEKLRPIFPLPAASGRPRGPVQRQKPRHVPSFCPEEEGKAAKFVLAYASEAELKVITEHYELGTIGLRRYAVTHQDEVDGFVVDFSKRSTRLANDSCDRTVVTVGFSGRKKRWTLCPSSECIPKADKREKVVGQWKIFYLPPGGDELVVPRCVHEAYADVVDDCAYFAATLCPQQTYCAKHSAQSSFLSRQWHYDYRHQYALQDFMVFCDHAQRVQAVWRLKAAREKYATQAEFAESVLIRVMFKAINEVRQTSFREQRMYNQPLPPQPQRSLPSNILLQMQSPSTSQVTHHAAQQQLLLGQLPFGNSCSPEGFKFPNVGAGAGAVSAFGAAQWNEFATLLGQQNGTASVVDNNCRPLLTSLIDGPMTDEVSNQSAAAANGLPMMSPQLAVGGPNFHVDPHGDIDHWPQNLHRIAHKLPCGDGSFMLNDPTPRESASALFEEFGGDGPVPVESLPTGGVNSGNFRIQQLLCPPPAEAEISPPSPVQYRHDVAVAVSSSFYPQVSKDPTALKPISSLGFPRHLPSPEADAPGNPVDSFLSVSSSSGSISDSKSVPLSANSPRRASNYSPCASPSSAPEYPPPASPLLTVLPPSPSTSVHNLKNCSPGLNEKPSPSSANAYSSSPTQNLTHSPKSDGKAMEIAGRFLGSFFRTAESESVNINIRGRDHQDFPDFHDPTQQCGDKSGSNQSTWTDPLEESDRFFGGLFGMPYECSSHNLCDLSPSNSHEISGENNSLARPGRVDSGDEAMEINMRHHHPVQQAERPATELGVNTLSELGAGGDFLPKSEENGRNENFTSVQSAGIAQRDEPEPSEQRFWERGACALPTGIDSGHKQQKRGREEAGLVVSNSEGLLKAGRRSEG